MEKRAPRSPTARRFYLTLGLQPLHLRGSKTAVFRHWNHIPIKLLMEPVMPTSPSSMFANLSSERGMIKSHRVAIRWTRVLERSLQRVSSVNWRWLLSVRNEPVDFPRLDGSISLFTIHSLLPLLQFPQRVDTSHGIAG